MPRPFTVTLVVLSSPNTSPIRLSMFVTAVLVSFNCEPLIASVELSLIQPSATLVSTCALPGALASPPIAINDS
ncbi:hypothetical protein D3C72_2458080 [compost metagenome]